ncbi:MAG: metallophosphoesterase family protein [Streptococcaceae bacterium]|jgi:putative phosphoesterase|nr:metallophosphoesterase family protein [Streptococcaceae bacterium]
MKHKIAILSDIHGNETALEAVIQDSKRENATEYWLLGDFVLPGSGASRMLTLLHDLSATVIVRGNWDDCFLESISGEIDSDNPEDVYIARLSQYLDENLSAVEIDFLRNLPLYEIREVEGLKFGISHNLPDKNWGGALIPASEQENFDQLFIEDDCDVAVYGHVHHQTLRYDSKERLIINPGTVGQPFSWWDKFRRDVRAQYAMLSVDAQGISGVDFRKVAYDVDVELQRAKEAGLPYIDLYQEQLEDCVAHTHDTELLAKINQQNHYAEDVKNYFNLD